MLRNISATELIILAVILIFLFGAKKIPELFQGIAKAIGEMRKSLSEDSSKEKGGEEEKKEE